MNLKKRLEHIAHMSGKDRHTGKTMMIARAAEQTGGIVIARSMDEAKWIEKIYRIPSRSMDINLEGFNGPFFLDHHATEGLLFSAANKINVLEKEIVKLRKYIKPEGYKRMAIDEALEKTGGDRRRAADLLGMIESDLVEAMKNYDF